MTQVNTGLVREEKIETHKERNAHSQRNRHTQRHTQTDWLDTHAKVWQREHGAVNTTNTAEILIKTPERKSFLIVGALPCGNPLWIILDCNTEGNHKVAESLAIPQHTAQSLHKDSVCVFNSQVTNQGQKWLQT